MKAKRSKEDKLEATRIREKKEFQEEERRKRQKLLAGFEEERKQQQSKQLFVLIKQLKQIVNFSD